MSRWKWRPTHVPSFFGGYMLGMLGVLAVSILLRVFLGPPICL